VIFLTDNGAGGGSGDDWELKLRGRKATVYEGGIRTACFMRRPGVFSRGAKVDRIAGYIDLAPTILDAAGLAPPKEVALDGVSLLSVLKGGPDKNAGRTMIIQWHQGLNPQMYRSFAVFNQKYKLVQAGGGFQRSGKYITAGFKYELFDIDNDPLEQKDLSSQLPGVVAKMKRQYEEWFWDVMKSRGPDPEQIYIGTEHENPSRLRASAAFVEQDEIPNYGTGQWPVRVVRGGEYEIRIVFHKGLKSAGKLQFGFGDVQFRRDAAEGAREFVFDRVRLKEGYAWLDAFVVSKNKRIVPTYVDVKLLG